jgi:hypothetical protein
VYNYARRSRFLINFRQILVCTTTQEDLASWSISDRFLCVQLHKKMRLCKNNSSKTQEKPPLHLSVYCMCPLQ